MSLLSDEAERLLRAVGPRHDEIQAEMAEFADEQGFPIIGPDAGGVLRTIARVTDAGRIFEFGSGFGYSAYWFLQGMAPDGDVVLTEIDAAELKLGESFLEDAGLAERATFERGDAMEIVDDYAGPFDVVLIDHQKRRYVDAFEAIRGKVPAGGVVVADNVMHGPFDLGDLVAHFQDGADLLDDEQIRGIAEYVSHVRDAEAFDTVILPVGNGLALTTRVAE